MLYTLIIRLPRAVDVQWRHVKLGSDRSVGHFRTQLYKLYILWPVNLEKRYTGIAQSTQFCGLFWLRRYEQQAQPSFKFLWLPCGDCPYAYALPLPLRHSATALAIADGFILYARGGKMRMRRWQNITDTAQSLLFLVLFSSRAPSFIFPSCRVECDLGSHSSKATLVSLTNLVCWLSIKAGNVIIRLRFTKVNGLGELIVDQVAGTTITDIYKLTQRLPLMM